MDVVGPDIIQLPVYSLNGCFLLLIVSAFPKRSFINRLLVLLAIFTCDGYRVVNIRSFFPGQVSLFSDQPLLQFSYFR